MEHKFILPLSLDDYQASEDMAHQFRTYYDLYNPYHPCKPEFDSFALQMELIKEELLEVDKAYNEESLEEYFKELCDLQYVVDQLFVASGMHHFKEAGIMAIHESNMSKLGADGKPVLREDGKILKGPNYKPVSKEQLSEILDS